MTAILGVIAERGLDTFAKIKVYFAQAPYHLRVVDDETKNLYLLKYDQIKTDFQHPAAQEARGIILEKGTNRVVCYPFSKFFNAGEKHAAEIDWSTATVQHKYDGSIIKLYWLASRLAGGNSAENSGESSSSAVGNVGGDGGGGGGGGRWVVATNGTTDARNAPADEQKGTTFYDLFKDAEKTANLDYARLDKDCTYMFELMHPDQLIVVRYKAPRLVHIGTRNNNTFRESYESIGVEQAETFPLHSMDACRNAAALLGPSQEGFVVCDASYRRVKVKGSVYLKLHHTLTGNSLTDEEVAAQLILQGEQSEVAAYEQDERIAGICKHIAAIEGRVDRLAEKLDQIWTKVMDTKPTSRKEVAVAFKKEAAEYFALMMSRFAHESSAKEKTTSKKAEVAGKVEPAGAATAEATGKVESAATAEATQTAEPSKSFFRQAIVEKFTAASVTRTDAREFLEFVKTK